MVLSPSTIVKKNVPFETYLKMNELALSTGLQFFILLSNDHQRPNC